MNLLRVARKIAGMSIPAKSAKKSNEGDTSTWLTRNEAMDLLGCSLSTLLNYEKRDKLHPARAMRVDGRGTERLVWAYDPRELAKLPNIAIYKTAARAPGEIAARAFEMFSDGAELDDIVKELRETPDHVQQLHEKWLDMRGARHVLTPQIRLAFEGLVGKFTDAAELLDLVTAQLARKAA